MSGRWWLATLFLVVFSVNAAAAPREPAPRIAILIGNDDYKVEDGWIGLTKIEADLKSMKEALESVGFKVLPIAHNKNRDEMKRAILELQRMIRQGDGSEIVAVYYAGHGERIGGRNFLIPVGARGLGLDYDQVRGTYLDVEWILEQIGESTGRVNIFFLDACRTNTAVVGLPMGAAIPQNHFGPVLPARAFGTVVSFAARPGTNSYEGPADRPNSYYTGALVKQLKVPNQTLHAILANVEHDVYVDSMNHQMPSAEGQELPKTVVLRQVSLPRPVPPRVDSDIEACNELKGNRNPEKLRGYLKRFPNGACAGYAAIRLAELTTPAPAPAPAPTPAPPAASAIPDRKPVTPPVAAPVAPPSPSAALPETRSAPPPRTALMTRKETSPDSLVDIQLEDGEKCLRFSYPGAALKHSSFSVSVYQVAPGSIDYKTINDWPVSKSKLCLERSALRDDRQELQVFVRPVGDQETLLGRAVFGY